MSCVMSAQIAATEQTVKQMTSRSRDPPKAPIG